MAKRVRKAAAFSARLAKAAKDKAKKQVEALIKAGIIDRKEARKILSYVTKEVREEKNRIKAFVKQELKRGAAKAKPLVKKAAKRAAKALKEHMAKRRRKR